MINIYVDFHAQYPLFFSHFNESRNLLGRFSKNNLISNFMKIHAVGTELFHADGRTDRRDDANSLFSQFCDRA